VALVWEVDDVVASDLWTRQPVEACLHRAVARTAVADG
jgi:hypothetical protein